MNTHKVLVILLAIAMFISLISGQMEKTYASPTAALMWNSFLFGIPILLGGFLLANQRWAFMACVIYGTVGLALDLATFVQELSRPDVLRLVLVSTGLSGTVNFLVMIGGGKGFLEVTQGATPPAGPRPSPPSPSAS